MNIKLSCRTDRATAAWVSFAQNITGRGYYAPNLIYSQPMWCNWHRIRRNNAK